MEPGNVPTAPSEQPAQPAGGPGMPKINKKLITIIVGAVLGVSILGAVGNYIFGKVVGFGVKKAIEAGTGVRVDERGGAVTVRGKDGAEVRWDVNTNGNSGTVTFQDEQGRTGRIEAAGSGEATSLPSDFPSDFPVMPGMTLDSVYTQSITGEGAGFVIGWKTGAGSDQISQYYIREMTDRGWTKSAEQTANNQTMLFFQKVVDQEKGLSDTATITIDQQAEGTTVGLVLSVSAR